MTMNVPNFAGTSPFDWRSAPRQTTNNRAPQKPDLRPKGMHTYQKAVLAEPGCYFAEQGDLARKAASHE